MTTKRPWMPLFVADFIADTQHLNASEIGAYISLIMNYWIKGKLPEDEEMIRRISKLSNRQWSQSRDLLRSLFLEGWKHKRVDEELAQVSEKSRVNSANAKRGHESRKEVAGVSPPNSHDTLQTHTQIQKEEVKDTLPIGSVAPPAVAPPSAPEPDPPAKPKTAKRAKARSALPDDFALDEKMLVFADERGFNAGEAQRMFSKFCDYHRMKGNVMADWSAAWRTWVQNQVEFGRKNGGSSEANRNGFAGNQTRRSGGNGYLNIAAEIRRRNGWDGRGDTLDLGTPADPQPGDGRRDPEARVVRLDTYQRPATIEARADGRGGWISDG